MRTIKYSEEQTIGFMRQAEAGLPVKEIGRKYGLSAFDSIRHFARDHLTGLSIVPV